MTEQGDWLPAQQATLAKLGQLRDLDRQAADEVERLWPVTLNALRAGINPIRELTVSDTATTTVEIAWKRLDLDLDDAIAAATDEHG